MKKPTYIKEYEIYDVFYNQHNEYCIIGPAFDTPTIKLVLDNTFTFDSVVCPKKHTNVYRCKHETFKENINLIINGFVVKNVKVNRYQNFDNKIILSTLVRNEDSYIKQWIEYHLMLGVDAFVIYDNSGYTGSEPKLSVETSTNLTELLKDYIADGVVELIDWPYIYRRKHTDKKEHNSAQTTQQNHSINAFSNSKLVGCMDIDEYVNLSNSNWIDLNEFFSDYVSKNKLIWNNISGFILRSKSFINKKRQNDENYEFMKIYDCSKILDARRRKTFVLPRNVKMFATHDVIHPIDRTKKRSILSGDIIYFNHYMSINKKNFGLRGRHLHKWDQPIGTDATIMFMYNKLVKK